MQDRKPTRRQCLIEMQGLPPDWQMLTAETTSTGWMIKGGVYPVAFLKGPRAGETDYSRPAAGTECTIELPADFFADWLALWEDETGLCAACAGQGKSLLKWTKRDGVIMQPCAACRGTGKVKREGKVA